MDIGADAGTADESNYLTAQVMATARAKLGERGSDITAVAMHSSVYYYLVQVGALTFSSSSLVDGGQIQWGGGGINLRNEDVAYFLGARVIVDDMLEPAATGTATHMKEYPVYCYGGGVVMEGVQQELRTEVDRNILSKQDVVSLPLRYARDGDELEGCGDNPANADLANKDNWELVYDTTKKVPMVRSVQHLWILRSALIIWFGIRQRPIGPQPVDWRRPAQNDQPGPFALLPRWNFRAKGAKGEYKAYHAAGIRGMSSSRRLRVMADLTRHFRATATLHQLAGQMPRLTRNDRDTNTDEKSGCFDVATRLWGL